MKIRIITIQVKPNKELNQLKFSFITDVKVLSPQSLRDKIKEKIEENLEKYFSDNKDKLTKYNEEPSTQLIYYNIPNKSIRKNTNSVTSNDQFKSFDTLKCLYDIPKLLRESSPSVPILLEILIRRNTPLLNQYQYQYQEKER